jgi:hypothetical protein
MRHAKRAPSGRRNPLHAVPLSETSINHIALACERTVYPRETGSCRLPIPTLCGGQSYVILPARLTC